MTLKQLIAELDKTYGQPSHETLLEAGQTIQKLVVALSELYHECDCADHWLRHTVAFQRAKEVLEEVNPLHPEVVKCRAEDAMIRKALKNGN